METVGRVLFLLSFFLQDSFSFSFGEPSEARRKTPPLETEKNPRRGLTDTGTPPEGG